MCEECTRVCCDGCPFGVSGTECAVCDVCREPIFADDEAFSSGERCICSDCVENLTVDEIISVGGLRDMSDLLALLGFRRMM